MPSTGAAQPICEKLVADNPTVVEYLSDLATNHNAIASILSTTRKPLEALAEERAALSIQEKLALDNPGEPKLRENLAWTLESIGDLLKNAGRPGEALPHFRRALETLEKLAADDPSVARYRFQEARCHAGLSAIAEMAGSGLSAAEGRAEADKAIEVLRRAVTAGFRDHDALRREATLDGLRTRPDFRLLMMDATFPLDAFAE